MAIATILIGALVAIAGLALVVIALFLYLRAPLGDAGAALLLGFVILALSGALLWLAVNIKNG